MKRTTVISEIENFAKEIGFQITNKSGSEISILSNYFSGIYFNLEFKKNGDVKFYFYHRTNSAIYNGERTDLHDIISVIFTAFIKVVDQRISCVLIDVPHPVAPSLNDFEIYARYIIPF